jgi:hypothetical protein
MRRLSKIVGGVLACTLCLFAGHRIVRGDAALQPAERPPGEVDPFQPYALGPGAISYDTMSPSQQAEVDLVQMTTDEAQSADSVAGFSRATSDTVERAKAVCCAPSMCLFVT